MLKTAQDVTAPQCFSCRHFHGERPGKPMCDKYKEIPSAIYYDGKECRLFQDENEPDTQAERSPVCSYCKHLTAPRTCRAFPDGNIPPEIWAGKNPHVKPVDGDRGVRFAAIIQPKTEQRQNI